MKKRTRQWVAMSALPLAFGVSASAAVVTWDGGDGSSPNTSEPTNWVGDTAPSATGDSLVFAGTNNLNVNNDFITSLGSTSFTFAAGAGSFNIGSSAGQIIVGNSGANDNFVTKVSTNDQTISANIKLVGGQRDRTIIMTGGGKLTLSGNVDFSNDWLFPTTTAGTIVLSGNNLGDGKGGVLNAGTNTARAMMRNNIANTTLVLGSDTALGNSGSGDVGLGTANFRGLVANQNLTITTTGGDRNLSGSTIIINTNKVTFEGADNLTIGNIINQGGNRDFWVTSTGGVTIQNSLSLSHDQNGRNLYLNIGAGSGGMVVNGKIFDTFHSGGITTGTSQLRKAGAGLLTLNGDSTYAGITSVEDGTLLVNGTHTQGAGANAGRYLVNAAATLGGSGTINLSDTNAGTTGMSVSGTLAPGAGGIGTLTVNGANSVRSMIALEGTGKLSWDLNIGMASDVLALTGASGSNEVFFNGNVINFTDLSSGSLAAGTYTLITVDAANAYGGLTLSGSTITAGLSIGTGLEAYAGAALEVSGNNIVLNIVPVPEPASLALVGLAGLALLPRRRQG